MSEKHSNIEIPWEEIDTILLDMDGTLLDLNFDNHVWNKALPAAYANKHSLNLESARASLIGHMREIQGTISFYSFDYWTRYTELDIIELHRNYAHLVEFRPGARSFLKWAKLAQKTTIIATNATPIRLWSRMKYAVYQAWSITWYLVIIMTPLRRPQNFGNVSRKNTI